jgi:tetraacyldisaccharide 4'-kinase
MTPAFARERIMRGWEHGFAPAERPIMAALSWGYGGLVRARERLYRHGLLASRRLERPVVALGNVTIGGTGKTPAAVLAVETLMAMGHRPAVVSRGYGRHTSGVRVVADTARIRLEPDEAGDEPFLLARRLPGVPVVVGSNRYEAASVAVRRFDASAIVLDDGFQHRTLAKDLEIVMARAERPWGNGRLLPAGPLREPLSALARADLLVAVGAASRAGAAAVAQAAARHAPHASLVAAVHVPTECWDAARMDAVSLATLGASRVLAFAGIAAPARFVRTLEELGARVADVRTFPDHHWYSAPELAALGRAARSAAADALVTTEKDWVRFRRVVPRDLRVWVLGVRLVLVSGEHEWRLAFEKACGSA